LLLNSSAVKQVDESKNSQQLVRCKANLPSKLKASTNVCHMSKHNSQTRHHKIAFYTDKISSIDVILYACQ